MGRRVKGNNVTKCSSLSVALFPGSLALIFIFRCSIYMPTHIGTYDVQNATLKPMPGAVAVHGVLVENTSAVGCFIVVKYSSDSVERYQAVVGNCSTTVSYLTKNTYTVLVYDLESDGLPGSTPAVSKDGVLVDEEISG